MYNEERTPAFRAEQDTGEKDRHYVFLHRKKALPAAIAAGILLFLLLIAAVPIHEVTVSGNRHYRAEELEERVFGDVPGRSALLTYLQFRFRPHKSIPFVEDYRIAFHDPVRVELIVYEKSLVGYVSYMGSNMYFDKDGMVVESTQETIEDVPLVTGMSFGHIVLNQALPVDDPEVFGEILILTQVLETSDIKTDRISFNESKEATLYIGTLTVRLGSSDNMSGKLMELKDILADYPDLSGTLYLDSYDGSNNNPMYRFENK